MKKLIAILAVSFVFVANSHAVEYSKMGDKATYITSVSTQPNRLNSTYANHDYITIKSNDSFGGGSCNEDLAVLPDKSATNDYSMIRSIALSAVVSGKTVDIFVDDSKKVGPFCYVVVLSIIN
ncbi:MAG: hypothetical protein OEZ58_20830 [Gammaproteobacteria bacterium]|nr:hypothetical protein [Gammaproteobacteria bacterium]